MKTETVHLGVALAKLDEFDDNYERVKVTIENGIKDGDVDAYDTIQTLNTLTATHENKEELRQAISSRCVMPMVKASILMDIEPKTYCYIDLLQALNHTEDMIELYRNYAKSLLTKNDEENFEDARYDLEFYIKAHDDLLELVESLNETMLVDIPNFD